MKDMMPRWRKVWRDLWGNKARTLLVVMSIAVGVFSVGMMAGSREISISDLNEQYQRTNDRSAWLSTSRIDEQFIRSLRQMDEVRDAEGRAVYILPTYNGTQRRNVWINVIDNFDNVQINRWEPLRGERVPPLREALIERSSAAALGKDIGDTITIDLPDGKKRDIRIAGMVYDVNAIPINFANFATIYITFDTAAWLGFPRDFNQIRFVAAENQYSYDHVNRIATEIEDRLKDSGHPFVGISIQNTGPGKHFGAEPLQAISLVLSVLGFLALLLSGFLVINTIAAVMTQHVRQIGIMKAIGARAMQIAMMYLVMVLVYSLLALVIAVPAGIIGARAMSNFIAGTINFDITSLTPPAWILLMQVGVGLALPLIAALIPVVNGVRINTRVAIFSTGTGSESSPPHPNRQVHLPLGLHKFTAIFAPILNRKSQILNRKFLLSIRNTFRRKGRLALTLCTLTLASAMFVAVFSARNSLDQALADSLKVLNYDIQFNLNNRFLDDTLMREALKVPGIISAETWEASNARRIFDVAQNNSTEGRNIGVFALPANTQFFKPEVLEGRWLQDDDIESIVVNTYVVEDDPDFKIDSFINLKIGNRTRAFRVVGIIRSVLQGPGSPRTLIYINQSGFRQILSLGRQSSRLLTVTAQKDGTSQAEIGRDLEERFKRINLLVSSYQTTTERANELRFQFDLITTFLLIMAAMLAVVGALGLTGTMSINVLERTREIGVMRAIGASNGSVRSVIIVEGIVIGLVSWALGALAAYPLSALLNSTVGVALLRIPPPLRFSWYGLFLWLAVVLMVATLASLWPAWRASQLTVREVLAYE